MPFIVILSIVSAGIFSALNISELSGIWIFPVSFVVCVIAFSLLFWFVIWLCCFFVPVKKEYDKPSRFHLHLLNLCYWFACSLARVKVHTTGLDKLPANGTFLFVSNHMSRFDNMLQCVAMRKFPLAFISKPSNFKIPIGRHLMARCCYISIDRENPKNALKSINRAAELLKSNAVSIGVFPEGSRGKSYDVREFKSGCFKAASKSGRPIAVATVFGTDRIHKNFPLRRTHVYFDILEIVECGNRKTVEISSEIREIMQKNLDKYKENQLK